MAYLIQSRGHMETRILLTGAPGNGGERGRERTGGQGTRFFDFRDFGTFTEAFADVSSVFPVRPPALSNVRRDITTALVAEQTSGVRHIAYEVLQTIL